jgi:hypothetical protein
VTGFAFGDGMIELSQFGIVNVFRYQAKTLRAPPFDDGSDKQAV